MASPAQPIERKLAAIFAADVAGYSRLMGEDEVGTMRALADHREVMDRLITHYYASWVRTKWGRCEHSPIT